MNAASFRGLYAILDMDAWARAGVDLTDGSALEDVAAALLSARPGALQLRHKGGASKETLALLRRLRVITGGDVPLVVNDRADLARLCRADAVHVGQDDLSVGDARVVSPGLAVGLSTHDLAQLADALGARPDYVAFGPVFDTQSKALADPTVGLSLLATACERASLAGLPLVAIGGIDLARAPAVRAAGASAAAVISALVAVGDDAGPDLREIERRARAFSALLAP